MSYLGTIISDERPEDQGRLEKMLNSDDFSQFKSSSTFYHETASLIIGDSGYFREHPMKVETSDVIVLMDGEFFALVASEVKLKASFENRKNDISFFIEAYEMMGITAVEKIEGSFTGILLDKRTDTLFAFNDRFGLRPLYYFHDEERIVLSTTVKGILEHRNIDFHVDTVGFQQMFRFSYFLGDRTPVSEIKCLRGATILKADIRTREMNWHQYWQLDYSEKTEDDEAKIALTLSELLTKAVLKRVTAEDDLGITLSGGMDSRAIAAALKNNDPGKIRSFTFGPPACLEQRIAEKVAGCSGFDHNKIFINISNIDYGGFSRGVSLTEGMDFHLEVFSNPSAERIKDTGVNIILANQGLDLFLGGSYIKKHLDYGLPEKELLDALFETMTINRDTSVFQDDRLKEMDGLLETYKGEWGRTSDCDPMDRVDMFNILNLVNRGTMYGSVYQRSFYEDREPSYDYELFDYLVTIPPELRKGHAIYFKAFRLMDKELSNIIYASTRAKPAHSLKIHRYSSILHFLIEKVRRKVRIATKGRFFRYPNSWNLNSEYLRHSEDFQGFVEETLLGDKTNERGIFNMDRVRVLIEDHLDFRSNNYMIIQMLLGMELWMRLFVDRYENLHYDRSINN